MAQTYIATWSNGDVSVHLYPSKPDVVDLMDDLDAHGPVGSAAVYRVKAENGYANIDIGCKRNPDHSAKDYIAQEGDLEVVELLSPLEFLKQRHAHYSSTM